MKSIISAFLSTKHVLRNSLPVFIEISLKADPAAHAHWAWLSLVSGYLVRKQRQASLILQRRRFDDGASVLLMWMQKETVILLCQWHLLKELVVDEAGFLYSARISFKSTGHKIHEHRHGTAASASSLRRLRNRCLYLGKKAQTFFWETRQRSFRPVTLDPRDTSAPSCLTQFAISVWRLSV